MKRFTRRKAARGMTLIEIMVVITILGIIATIVGVNVMGQLDDAKVDTARIEIKQLASGMDHYYMRKSKYPDTATGLKALLDAKIISELKADPWGNEYVYTNQGGKPVIVSYGKDGEAGTADDISSAASTK